MIAERENISTDAFEKIISEYLYANKFPMQDTVLKLSTKTIKLLERKTVFQKFQNIITDFIDRFEI